MNKKLLIRIGLSVLILALILFACSRGESGGNVTNSPDVTVTVTPKPTPTPTSTPEITPTPVYNHPLTGRTLDEPFPYTRPFAISINDVPGALPQCSIEGADIIFEVLMEGATRMVAIYSSLDGVGKIGSIRSVRPVSIDIALAYDAILFHAGGSEPAYDQIRTKEVDNIDAVRGPFNESNSTLYYREPSRADRAWEHRLFSSDERLFKYFDEYGFRTEHEEGFDYGLLFTEDAAPEDGESADTISVRYDYCGKTSAFTYSENDNKYYMRQYSQDYTDGNSGNNVGFENVLILYTKARLTGDYLGHVDIETTGSGSGFFACGGKYIEIIWSRNDREPFIFETVDGEPLELNVGTTFVCCVPPTANSDVTFK